MAFDDVLARDPKSEEEFWAIIEETFVQVEGALTAYPAETREEALAGTCAMANSKTHHFPSFGIAECAKTSTAATISSSSVAVPPEVEQQIKARKLTPKFAKDWGVVMMCHGFISAHILDDSDGFRDCGVCRQAQSGKNRPAKMGRASDYPRDR